MSYKLFLKKFGRVHSPWTRSLYLCKRKKEHNPNDNANDNYFNGTQRYKGTKFFLNTKITNEIRKLGIYITIITKTK